MTLKQSIPVALLALLLPATALAGSSAQMRAFSQLQARYAAARAVWQPGLAGPHMVTGLAAHPAGRDAEARSRTFLKRYRTLFGLRNAQLRLLQVEPSRLREVVRFQQVAGELPVLGRVVAVTFDRHGELLSVASDAVVLPAFKHGGLGALAAAERAVRAVVKTRAGERVPKLATSAKEVVWASWGDARHAWAVRVTRTPGVEHLRVVVDATDGRILQISNLVRH